MRYLDNQVHAAAILDGEEPGARAHLLPTQTHRTCRTDNIVFCYYAYGNMVGYVADP